MSSARLGLLALPLALGLPLLTGGCGGSVAVAAVSYGADGILLAETGKTTTDHFASMVTKKDCAIWRVMRSQTICRPREGDKDPYDVNYDEPFRDMSEGGGHYGPPLRAAPGAPPSSWDAAAYQPVPPPPPGKPTTAVVAAEPVPPTVAAIEPGPAPAVEPPKPKKPEAGHRAAARKRAPKKPSPDRVAADP